MNTLPTNPPRYIAFIKSWTNPKKRFWYIIENGQYVTFGVLCVEAVLQLWGTDPPSTVYDESLEKFVPLVLGA